MESVDLLRSSILRAKIAPHPVLVSTLKEKHVESPAPQQVPISNHDDGQLSRVERKLDTLLNILKGLDVSDLPAGGETSKYLPAKHIRRLVCEYFNTTEDELSSRSRIGGLVRVRHIGMYLCRIHTMKSLVEIAKLFNRTDHTTTINAVHHITDSRKTDRQLDDDLIKLEARIATLLERRNAV